MPDIDFNQVVNAAIGGGAVWAAIRTEIKYLWREVDALKLEIKELYKLIHEKK